MKKLSLETIIWILTGATLLLGIFAALISVEVITIGEHGIQFLI